MKMWLRGVNDTFVIQLDMSAVLFRIGCLLGWLVGAAMIPEELDAADRSRRPNVLVVVSDDQSWPHCGAYGDDLAHTPAFDRIAHEGVLFTHAFCAASQCGPSRASLLAGQNPWQLGTAGSQASLFPKSLVVYPDVLAAEGYFVGYTGKPYAPGNWQAGGRASNPAGEPFNKIRLKPPTSEISTIDYAANFDQFLETRPQGAPFCFWFGCVEPHRDYQRGSAEEAGWDPAEVKVPPYLPDEGVVRSDLLDYYLEIEWFDRQLDRILKRLERAGELDHTLVIVTSDNGMPFPRSKATVFDSGTRVPLAIRWPVKISAGRVVDDLVSLVDIAPTILDAFECEPSQPMTGKSLWPILVNDHQGLVEPHRQHLLLGKERHNHARAGNVGYPQRAIRTRQFLYIRNLKPDRWPMGDPPGYFCHTKMNNPSKDWILENQYGAAAGFYAATYAKRSGEELYDVVDDPHCLNNLAAEKAWSSVKDKLNAKLMKELRDQQDPRALGYGDLFDSYPFYGRIQPTIPGFKEIGKYNPGYWPFDDRPLPTQGR